MFSLLITIFISFLFVPVHAAETWTSYTTQNSGIASNQINDMFIDESGYKWFVHKSIGKYSKFDGISWTVYTKEDVPPGPWTDFKAKTGDIVWTASGQGLIRKDGVNEETIFDMSTIKAIKTDKKGNLWASGNLTPFSGNTISKFDGTGWTTHYLPVFGSFFLDITNVLWILRYDKTLQWFDGRIWKYETDDVFSNCKITVDKNNIKWIISRDYGPVMIYDGKEWQYTDIGALNMSVDNNNKKWFVIEGYVSSYDDTLLTEYIVPDGNYTSIASDDSLVWLASEYSGTLCLKKSFMDSSYTSKRPVKFTVKVSDKPSVIDNHTSDPDDIFPMEIGDTWIYKRNFIYRTYHSYEDKLVKSVMDKVVIDNQVYSLFSDGALFRKDSADNIYAGSSLIFDFSNPEIEVYDCYNPYFGPNDVGRRTKGIIEVPAGTFNGYSFGFSGIGAVGYSLAPGIGVIRSYFWGDVGDEETLALAGARISGREYGVISNVKATIKNPALIELSIYPNPFNSSTAIEFVLPGQGNVELSVYNISGQKILTLVDGKLAAGKHSYRWDGRDGNGIKVSSGLYFACLVMGKNIVSRKLLLLK